MDSTKWSLMSFGSVWPMGPGGIASVAARRYIIAHVSYMGNPLGRIRGPIPHGKWLVPLALGLRAPGPKGAHKPMIRFHRSHGGLWATGPQWVLPKLSSKILNCNLQQRWRWWRSARDYAENCSSLLWASPGTSMPCGACSLAAHQHLQRDSVEHHSDPTNQSAR